MLDGNLISEAVQCYVARENGRTITLGRDGG
jgi:hypothetical protein